MSENQVNDFEQDTITNPSNKKKVTLSDSIGKNITNSDKLDSSQILKDSKFSYNFQHYFILIISLLIVLTAIYISLLNKINRVSEDLYAFKINHTDFDISLSKEASFSDDRFRNISDKLKSIELDLNSLKSISARHQKQNYWEDKINSFDNKINKIESTIQNALNNNDNTLLSNLQDIEYITKKIVSLEDKYNKLDSDFTSILRMEQNAVFLMGQRIDNIESRLGRVELKLRLNNIY